MPGNVQVMSAPKMRFSYNENLHQQVEVLIHDSGSVGFSARELEGSAPHLNYNRCREILDDFVAMGYICKNVNGDLRVYSKVSKNSAPKRSKDTGQRRNVRPLKKEVTLLTAHRPRYQSQ